MGRSTYYDILEVDPNSSQKGIKAAFLRLAVYYHPDKVKHLGEVAQKQAEEKMKSITEAFNALQNPKKRALYDRCLREGLDYTVEYSRAQTETDADRKMRAQKAENRQYMLQAAGRVLKENIAGLVPGAKFQVDEGHDYYDYILSGHGGGNRYRIHIKVLDDLNMDDIEGIIAHADSIEGKTSMSLMRDHFSFVIVACRFKESLKIRERLKKYNSAMTRAKRGEPRRGLVLIKMDRPKPFVPHGDFLQPPFNALQLRLV